MPFFMIGMSKNQKVYYVSSSQGDDSNDGTEEKPLRSLSSSKIPKSGCQVKLKCGDVFYEKLSANGNEYLSYGKGEKPIISGWKVLPKSKAKWIEGRMKSGKWVELKGTHIWRLDLTESVFEGRVNSSDSYENNIGLIMEVDTKKMHGHKCEFIFKEDCNDPHKHPQRNTFLKKNFDFAQSSKTGGDVHPSNYRYLYMFLDHNPAQHELKFSTHGNGIFASNTNINGIRVEGFSCHGIACGSNVSISDCEIEYIGGAQQIDYPIWVRYGNGIEFYLAGTRKDGHVFNNRISHTFDCATTIQGSDRIGAVAKNIIIEKNIIKNCRQAFEFFLNNDDKKNHIQYDCEKCEFRDNVCIDSGENGFDSPEYRDTHILSYQKDHLSSVVIEKNIFIGGKGFYTAPNPHLIIFGKNDFYYSDGAILWGSGNPHEEVLMKDRNTWKRGKESLKYLSVYVTKPNELKKIKSKWMK